MSPTSRALFNFNNLQHLNLHSHSRNYKNCFFDLCSARNTFPKAAPRRISGVSTVSPDSCLPVPSLLSQFTIFYFTPTGFTQSVCFPVTSAQKYICFLK